MCGSLWRLYVVHIHMLPILFVCSIIYFRVGVCAYKHYQAMNVFVLSHILIYVTGYGGGHVIILSSCYVVTVFILLSVSLGPQCRLTVGI